MAQADHRENSACRSSHFPGGENKQTNKKEKRVKKKKKILFTPRLVDVTGLRVSLCNRFETDADQRAVLQPGLKESNTSDPHAFNEQW